MPSCRLMSDGVNAGPVAGEAYYRLVIRGKRGTAPSRVFTAGAAPVGFSNIHPMQAADTDDGASPP